MAIFAEDKRKGAEPPRSEEQERAERNKKFATVSRRILVTEGKHWIGLKGRQQVRNPGDIVDYVGEIASGLIDVTDWTPAQIQAKRAEVMIDETPERMTTGHVRIAASINAPAPPMAGSAET